MSFFQLHPRATIHVRHNGDIQLGTNPQTAVIVRGLTRDTLRCIDGHHDIDQLAALSQTSTKEIADLLHTLHDAGLVIEPVSHSELPLLATHERRSLLREAQKIDIASRLETMIYIHGLNRLGVLIGSLLREAGFPHLRFVDERPVTHNDVQVWGFGRIDVGQRRDRTLTLMHESISEGSLHKQIHPRVTVPCDLHIVVNDQQSDWAVLNPNSVEKFLSSGQAHMLIGYGDTQAIMSPILTSHTHGCARCYFHSLVDRDSSWPLIFDNVTHQDICDRAPIGLLLDTAIDVGQRVSNYFSKIEDDTLLTVNWPSRERLRSTWIAHPACGCQWDSMI